VHVGLVSYYIDVKTRIKVKVSSVRAMKCVYYDDRARHTLLSEDLYATDANHINAAAVETTTIVESSPHPLS
jgi:hypothetical protein